MIALGVFVIFFIAVSFVLASDRFYEYTAVNLPPLIRNGLQGKCTGTFVMATDPGQTAREWFHPRTLILGWGKNNERGPAEATFVFALPQNIAVRLSATPVVE